MLNRSTSDIVEESEAMNLLSGIASKIFLTKRTAKSFSIDLRYSTVVFKTFLEKIKNRLTAFFKLVQKERGSICSFVYRNFNRNFII